MHCLKNITMQYYSVKDLIKDKKRALNNARRQRRKEELRKDVRVSSRFWEQVARDYQQLITRISKPAKDTGEIPVCSCGGLEYFTAPIIGARCKDCRKPI
jgi:hypothetical protein